MNKLLVIFSFIVLYITTALGQANVVFPIIVHDNLGVGTEFPIFFGLDLTATDGVDTHLDEAELPGPPPGNAYYAAWILPDGPTQSYHDYRAPGNPPAFPYTGNKQYSIKIQSTDYPMTIVWNLPPQIANTSTIKDPFGGVIVNKIFAGLDSVVVTNSLIQQLIISVDYDAILPVELTSFTASVVGNGVQLNWITATEINNLGFDVERKSNTISGWKTVGYVPGNGTSTEERAYSFLDENIPDGSYSYRLKQIDFDGTFMYSNELVVNVGFNPTNFVLLQNYPNPFNPATSIQFQASKEGLVSVKIYNMLGQEVRTLFNEEVAPGRYTIQWDGLSDNGMRMSSGIYLYRMTASDFSDTKDMILLK